MADDSTASLRKAFALGGIGFGVFGVVAPSAFVSSYGMKASPTPNIFVRLFGTRSLALGASTLLTEDAESRRRILGIGFAMNVLDVAVSAAATDLPAKSRVMGVTTTAAFAALAGYLRSQS